MKIDRLIGILSILLNHEKVTAAYLAEKFEVSVRTVNRDVETLCQAGIPVVTVQGHNGGISIMEGYRLDKTLLTSSDMQSILAGLRSLDSISGTSRYRQLMDKLSFKSSGILTSNEHILIDLSSWYKDSLTPKIELLQDSIKEHRLVSFDYYSPREKSSRTVEPYLLIFRWSSWYVQAYCLEREDFRLFKLNRIVNLQKKADIFSPRPLPELSFETDKIFPNLIRTKILFDSEAEWKLLDYYGPESYRRLEDGRLLFTWDFTEKDYLFPLLLSFGKQAELLEPEEWREDFAFFLEEVRNKYE